VTIDDPAERYRRLAEALLQRMHPFGRVEARLGALPEEWPAPVAVPPGSTVIGSVTHRRDSALASMTVYLEGGPTGDLVRRHYAELLGTQGWAPFTPREPGGMAGFRSAMDRSFGVVFCRTEQDPFYSIFSSAMAGATRTVVSWDAGLDHHPQRQPLGSYAAGGPLARLIPILDAPDGVPVQGGGGGGSESELYLSARAHTKMPVPDLATHYQGQLTRAGWTLRDEGGDPVVAWSRWKLAEDDYQAMLVIAEPLAELRDLTLTIRSPSRAARGWRTYTAAALQRLG
jgi:hypothetical protein